MASYTVRVIDKLPKWTVDTERKMDKAVLVMATDIHRTASMLAPRDTGNLLSSGRINRKGWAYYSISFGGGAIRYARRRHFENRKNPQTLLYLQRAGDNITRGDIKRYITW